MGQRVTRAGLEVDDELADFVEAEALPGTGIAAEAFWRAFAAILRDLAPKNRALLAMRDRMQARDRRLAPGKRRAADMAAYRGLPAEIGYLVDGGAGLRGGRRPTSTPRSPRSRGPQLVVPVMNARYALNAANARWGSLYDALYGTDAIPETDGRERGAGYNPARGAAVIAWARAFLDEAVPLDGASWDGGARLRGGGAAARGGARRRRARRAEAAGAVRGLPRRCRRRRARSCCATTASASRSWSIPAPRSGGRSGARLRRPARGGDHRDHGLRGLGRGGRRRRTRWSSIATGSG